MKLISFLAAVTVAGLVFPFEVTANAALTVIQADTGVIVFFAEAALTEGYDADEVTRKINEMKDWLTSDERGELKLPIDQKRIARTNADSTETVFDYGVTFELAAATDGTVIQLALRFVNLESYIKFNSLDAEKFPKSSSAFEESLFFVWRTTTIPNPYMRFFETDSNALAITKRFNDDFNGGRLMDNFYVFSTSTRRTDTNADNVQNNIVSYDYYYRIKAENQKDVIIRDRYPNTPAWYILAVVATAVAMTVFYFLMKSKEKNKQPGYAIKDITVSET